MRVILGDVPTKDISHLEFLGVDYMPFLKAVIIGKGLSNIDELIDVWLSLSDQFYDTAEIRELLKRIGITMSLSLRPVSRLLKNQRVVISDIRDDLLEFIYV